MAFGTGVRLVLFRLGKAVLVVVAGEAAIFAKNKAYEIASEVIKARFATTNKEEDKDEDTPQLPPISDTEVVVVTQAIEEEEELPSQSADAADHQNSMSDVVTDPDDDGAGRSWWWKLLSGVCSFCDSVVNAVRFVWRKLMRAVCGFYDGEKWYEKLVARWNWLWPGKGWKLDPVDILSKIVWVAVGDILRDRHPYPALYAKLFIY